MIAATLVERAKAAELTIATAESCTGGLIAGAITDVPGASDMFDRGFVTYSNAAKVEMLGVSKQLLSAHGAVSEPVASAMAEGTLLRSTADLGLAVTGIAGPGGSEAKPEGRVCFALARRDGRAVTETVDFGPRGRDAVRAAAVEHAIGLLASTIP